MLASLLPADIAYVLADVLSLLQCQREQPCCSRQHCSCRLLLTSAGLLSNTNYERPRLSPPSRLPCTQINAYTSTGSSPEVSNPEAWSSSSQYQQGHASSLCSGRLWGNESSLRNRPQLSRSMLPESGPAMPSLIHRMGKGQERSSRQPGSRVSAEWRREGRGGLMLSCED